MDNSHSDIKEKTFEATQVPLQRFSHQHRFLEDLFIFWISIGNFTVAGCTCNSEITDFVSCRLIWKRQYRSLRKSLDIVDCSFCSSWSVPIFPCKGTCGQEERQVTLRFRSEGLPAAFRKFYHASKIWVFRRALWPHTCLILPIVRRDYRTKNGSPDQEAKRLQTKGKRIET